MPDYGLGSFYGGIMNIAATGFNNAMALNREKYARIENYKYGEMAAEAADARTRALYNDLYSPQAKLQQLKEAGLSPALFYEGAGVGGGTQAGAMGTGAAGIAPNIFPIDPLKGAQIELTHAEARKANAQAATEEGTSEMGRAKIAELLGQAHANEAAAQLNESNKLLADIQAYVAGSTKDFDIDYACSMAREARENAEKAAYSKEREHIALNVDEKTQDAVIENAYLENSKLVADIAATKAKTALDEQQKKNLQNDIALSWKNYHVALQRANAETKNAATRIAELKQAKYQFENEMQLNYKKYDIEADRLLLEFGDEVEETTGINIGVIKNQKHQVRHFKRGQDHFNNSRTSIRNAGGIYEE